MSDASVSVSDSLPFGDEDLFFRLRNFEDHFVERKVYSDQKDWLKTVVAFANSTPEGWPAVLFIGVTDKGIVQSSKDDLDTVQKNLGKILDTAYPPIYYMTHVLKEGDQQFLAVVVPGSPSRPHFAGRSYVRRGSASQEASEAQFQALIAERSSKVFEIRKWIGREVQAMLPDPSSTYKPLRCRLEEATSFWILVKPLGVPNADSGAFTVPLERVELAFSPKDDRLILVIDRWWPGFGK